MKRKKFKSEVLKKKKKAKRLPLQRKAIKEMSHLGTRKELGKQVFIHLGQMFYDNSALIAVATRTDSN